MLEVILDKYIFFVLMGIAAVLGIVSKLVVSVALGRLVRAAGNMNKSSHPFMRLVRARFEHACMISDGVENVRAFVDKYLYEYRVLGMKLHSWRRLELTSASMCLILGALGAVLEYMVYGMRDQVLRTGVTGAVLAIIVCLFHLTTDERYRLEAARTYMVDYLQNICLHRFEKREARLAEQDDRQEPVRPHPGREVPSPRTSPEILPPTMPEPYEAPEEEFTLGEGEPIFTADAGDIVLPEEPPARMAESEQPGIRLEPQRAQSKQPDIRLEPLREEAGAAQPERSEMSGAQPKRQEPAGARAKQQEERRQQDKDILIRQILEEFMA